MHPSEAFCNTSHYTTVQWCKVQALVQTACGRERPVMARLPLKRPEQPLVLTAGRLAYSSLSRGTGLGTFAPWILPSLFNWSKMRCGLTTKGFVSEPVNA